MNYLFKGKIYSPNDTCDIAVIVPRNKEVGLLLYKLQEHCAQSTVKKLEKKKMKRNHGNSSSSFSEFCKVVPIISCLSGI